MPSVSDILHEYRAVVITGGSSSLGHSFLSLLNTIGYSGLICNLSRQKPELKNVESALKHFPCDLERFKEIEENCKSLIDFLEKSEGPILLINNSGFGGYGCFPAPNLEHNLSMVDLNARAPLHLTGRLLPLLEVRGGAVVNIASTAAFQPTPFLATYGATKAFLLHWSLSLYEDLKPKGFMCFLCAQGLRKRISSNAQGLMSLRFRMFLVRAQMPSLLRRCVRLRSAALWLLRVGLISASLLYPGFCLKRGHCVCLH